MKQILFSITTLALFSMTTIAQSQTDDTQIRKLVQTLEDGWAKKDGNLFAQPFAEDADYVVINGSHIKGRPAIAEGHQHIFDTFYKETFIKNEMVSIRYIKPDIAIVHVKAAMTGTSFGKPVDTHAMITLVVEKKPGGWQIDAFQNTGVEAQR